MFVQLQIIPEKEILACVTTYSYMFGTKMPLDPSIARKHTTHDTFGLKQHTTLFTIYIT